MANHSEVKENVKKAYDDIAAAYLDWTEPSHSVRLSYVEKLLQRLDVAGRTSLTHILELGCGAGVPCTKHLASFENVHVIGNDISPVQIAMAKERLPNSVDLIRADMAELEFSLEQFDGVVAFYSIIHLPRDEQTTMVRRIFQWLKPGGRFLANFGADEFVEATDPSWLGGKEGAMYWSGWGRQETQRILRDVGFELEIDEVVVDSEEADGHTREVPFHWILARKV